MELNTAAQKAQVFAIAKACVRIRLRVNPGRAGAV